MGILSVIYRPVTPYMYHLQYYIYFKMKFKCIVVSYVCLGYNYDAGASKSSTVKIYQFHSWKKVSPVIEKRFGFKTAKISSNHDNLTLSNKILKKFFLITT